MSQVMFALFKSNQERDAALREMADRGFSRERCRVTLHRDRISEGDLCGLPCRTRTARPRAEKLLATGSAKEGRREGRCERGSPWQTGSTT